LQDTVLGPHQPIDISSDLVPPPRVERHRDLLFEAEGGAVLERLVSPVVAGDALFTGSSIMIRAEGGLDDGDFVGELAIPGRAIQGQQLFECGAFRVPQVAVQGLQGLVHAVSQERFDRLGIPLDLVEVAVLVLQRAFLEGAQAGMGEKRHATPLRSGSIGCAPDPDFEPRPGSETGLRVRHDPVVGAPGFCYNSRPLRIQRWRSNSSGGSSMSSLSNSGGRLQGAAARVVTLAACAAFGVGLALAQASSTPTP